MAPHRTDRAKKSSDNPRLTVEQFFKKKLEEMGLYAKYTQEMRYDRGAMHNRMLIEIRRIEGNRFLTFLGGGFYAGNTYYLGSAYEQGVRRLKLLEDAGVITPIN